jgi:hypothetical protein
MAIEIKLLKKEPFCRVVSGGAKKDVTRINKYKKKRRKIFLKIFITYDSISLFRFR